MPNRHREKGDREERDVVNRLRKKGFDCERTLESGKRSDGTEPHDISIYVRGREGTPLKGECKLRADGFKQVYKWLADNDFLTIRADRKERLVVMPERVWHDFLNFYKMF